MNWSSQVNSVLNNIATKFGPVLAAGAKDGFAIFMRQVYFWGIESVISALAWLVVSYAVYKLLRWAIPAWAKWYREVEIEPYSQSKDTFGQWLVATVGGLGVLIFAACAVTSLVGDIEAAIGYFVNPAYYAIQMAAHLVK